MITEAMKRMIAVRTTLILDQPFWGTLALQLQLQEDATCETAWVDGQTLGFNPQFVNDLPRAQREALFAHEVGHCMLGHPWRRAGRDSPQWNEACDRALNPVLRDAKFILPDGAYFEFDPTHKGKSAEWIFNRLPRPLPGDGEQGKDGDNGKPGNNGQPGDDEQNGDEDDDAPSFGEVRDAPTSSQEDDEEEIPTEEQWKQVVQQAAKLAAGQGKLPAGLARLAEQAVEPRVDWRSVLRRFVQETAHSDYSWTQPNTRYLVHGLYLPALRSREVGPLLVAIDTSGSIDNTLLAIFGAELQSIAEELQPRRVHVMYCDARLQREDVFEREDVIELHPQGGGGTDFRPVFEALPNLEEPPVCILYLTDLRGTFPLQAPELPVLWVTTQRDANRAVPFGEIVMVDA